VQLLEPPAHLPSTQDTIHANTARHRARLDILRASDQRRQPTNEGNTIIRPRPRAGQRRDSIYAKAAYPTRQHATKHSKAAKVLACFYTIQQHTATHCNTLHHSAPFCTTLHHRAPQLKHARAFAVCHMAAHGHMHIHMAPHLALHAMHHTLCSTRHASHGIHPPAPPPQSQEEEGGGGKRRREGRTRRQSSPKS